MSPDILIDLLKKIDTASLSDALDSLGFSGGLLELHAQSSNDNICGQAFTVKYGDPTDEDKKLTRAADFIDEVNSNEIIVLANNGRIDCTVWGGILTNLAKSKNISGTVIDGMCRDLNEIQKLNYPVFSKGVFMQTGKGRTKKIAIQTDVYICNVKISPGDYIRGDKNGVIVIPKELVEETIKRAQNIINTEKLILNSVLNGNRLDESRKKFRYDKPWNFNCDK